MSKAAERLSRSRKGRTGRVGRFTITKSISPTPMTQAEWEASEELLARLVARAIMADYRRQHEEMVKDD